MFPRSDARADGVVFRLGDEVRLMRMDRYDPTHPLHNHVGEVVVIEHFTDGRHIKVPAPERRHYGYWIWDINFVEPVKAKAHFSSEDFDAVFEGGSQ